MTKREERMAWTQFIVDRQNTAASHRLMKYPEHEVDRLIARCMDCQKYHRLEACFPVGRHHGPGRIYAR